MKRHITGLLILLALMPLASQAQPNQLPPGQISYQGFLTDANGIPLATNTPRNVTVAFRIYNASSAGAVLWGEQQVVTVDRGYFSVMLGAGSSIGAPTTNNLTSIFSGSDASDRYLGLTVTDLGAAEIVPRLRLLASPYSFLAANALNVSGANTILANNLATNIGVWTVGGNNVYRPSGNVGIGTSAPGTPLEVNGAIAVRPTAASTQAQLKLDAANSSATLASRIDFLQQGLPKWAIINDFGQNGTEDLRIVSTVNGNSPLNMQQNGNVGIGRTSPTSALDVNGTVTATSFKGDGAGLTGVASQGGNSFTGNQTFGTDYSPISITDYGRMDLWSPFGPYYGAGIVLHDASDYATGYSGALGYALSGGEWSSDAQRPDIVLRASNGRLLLQSGNGASALCISTANTIGIGTANPTRGKVEINGSSGTYTTTATGYVFQGIGSTGAYPNWNGPGASLWASINIAANAFISFSDARIKHVEGHSDAARDLATLQGIEITDFTYIDTMAKGTGKQKKIIAQQVEKVFPQAVSKSTDVVPDIYQQATVKDGWVKLATNLKKGERVKLITEASAGVYEVLETTNGQFRTEFKPEGDQVIVFGREVKDFRSVDYEALSMLNVSATQELAKRVQKLEARESHLAALEQKALRLSTLEQEVADLKLMVAKLAEAGKGLRAAAQNTTQAHPAAVGSQTFTTASLDR